MKVKIYVEGGGEHDSLLTKCKQGFSDFFQKCGLKGRMPKVVVCGSRNNAYNRFRTAIKDAEANELVLLLVDSESPVTSSPWEHVRNRQGDNWQKPAAATDNHLHFMVQIMESWFLADQAALQKFYGQGFKVNKLPAGDNVETVPKQQVFSALEAATKDTKTKGSYSKGSHSFQILGLIDPQKMRQASPIHARRFFETLEANLTG